MDKAEIEKINISIMNFIAACAMPFTVVNMPPFVNILRTLNQEFIDGNHLLSPDKFRQLLLSQPTGSGAQREKNGKKRKRNKASDEEFEETNEAQQATYKKYRRSKPKSRI